METKRVLLGMSGGVDSSAAAILLQRQGCEVVGCTLRLYDNGNSDGVERAAAVADKLQIPFDTADFTGQFRCCVMEPFVSAYVAGRTPNPCVDCNRKLKFGALNDAGYALYELNGETFRKDYPCIAGANYPDMGCNSEFYTQSDPGFLEIESLSPMLKLAEGASATHTEVWTLTKGC